MASLQRSILFLFLLLTAARHLCKANKASPVTVGGSHQDASTEEGPLPHTGSEDGTHPGIHTEDEKSTDTGADDGTHPNTDTDDGTHDGAHPDTSTDDGTHDGAHPDTSSNDGTHDGAHPDTGTDDVAHPDSGHGTDNGTHADSGHGTDHGDSGGHGHGPPITTLPIVSWKWSHVTTPYLVALWVLVSWLCKLSELHFHNYFHLILSIVKKKD